MESQPLMKRFHLTALKVGAHRDDLAEAVREDLGSRPKSIPCRFLYDLRGAELFERICELPEYYLTRKERELLQAHATEIADGFSDPVHLVELGSGNAVKTRLLIEAMIRRHGPLCYIPIDLAADMLEGSSLQLLAGYPELEVQAIAGEYQEGLRHIRKLRGKPKLILWLGSNVGNLIREDAAGFLMQFRAAMGAEDRALLGIDLRKDRQVLERAYDDSRGVTASFIFNVLERLNRELSADFDPDAFAYRARYDEDRGRVEMHLVSKKRQQVYLKALDLTVAFEPDEQIHMENSYKYSLEEIDHLALAARLKVARQWLDDDRWFSLNLLAPLLA